MNRFLFIFCLPAVALIFLAGTGCAPLRPQTDPAMDGLAVKIAQEVRSSNKEIMASKGLGWAVFETPSQTVRYRIAWAALFPGKARLTLMVAGQPVETILADGKGVTFVSHTGRHGRHRVDSVDPNLAPYIDVDIRLSEVISVLLGRIPVKPFNDAYFSPADPDLTTVTLHDNRTGPVQNLYIDAEQTIRAISFTKRDGTPFMDMEILSYQSYDFGKIPGQIRFEDTAGKRVTLTISRFEPNPDIKPALFILTQDG
ncbi:MAG: hypothetical protein MI862_05735 [Desulfobacterales bacterium]|nr:hypothetical protein [Desulfobacterales bacterium]